MGRRITRKQLKQDEFVSTVDTVLRWGTGYWRAIAFGLGAVAVVVLIWWVGDRWISSRADDASYQLYKAVTAYEKQQAGESVDADENAESLLLEVIDRYGRSDQADNARMYLARINMDRGEVDAARSLLVEIVERHPSDALGGLATLDLIHLRVASGESAEVAQELESMVAGTDQRLPRDSALFELGELFLHQRDTQRAQTYFQKLVDDFPTSAYVNRARQRLTELG
jgi:TolA-binding protein